MSLKSVRRITTVCKLILLSLCEGDSRLGSQPGASYATSSPVYNLENEHVPTGGGGGDGMYRPAFGIIISITTTGHNWRVEFYHLSYK